MCLIVAKKFLQMKVYETVNTARTEHLIKVHANNKNMDLFYFQTLENTSLKQPNWSICFQQR